MTDRYTTTYRELKPAEQRKVDDIKNVASRLAELMEYTMPCCRETSIAITRLDEVVMWATKAIAK